MIPPKFIQQQAHRDRVRDSQVEKDYVLSWALYGLSTHTWLPSKLVFKGGTVLKKVYFKDYRYSEDLDFTLADETYTNEQLIDAFTKIFSWIAEKANIPLSITRQTTHSSGSLHFYVQYQGPLGGTSAHKHIKVDITRGEQLIFSTVTQDAWITYPDLAPFSLLCYPLEEVLIEKMCALMGRTEPRDLYDFWYLLESSPLSIDHLWPEFSQKAQHKGHVPGQFFSKVKEKLPAFEGRWKGSLSKQIDELPHFEVVMRNVNQHLRRTSKHVS